MASSTAQQQFINTVLPYAQEATDILKKAGINVDPRSIVAQWCHETGYGTNTGAKNNNLAGMYAYVGSPYGINGKTYANLNDFVSEYTKTLENKRYSGINNTGSDVTAFAYGLQAGGYATDSHYATAATWTQAFNQATQLMNASSQNMLSPNNTNLKQQLGNNLTNISNSSNPNSLTAPYLNNSLFSSNLNPVGANGKLNSLTMPYLNNSLFSDPEKQVETATGTTLSNIGNTVKLYFAEIMIFVFVVFFLYVSLVKDNPVGKAIS